MEETNPKNSKWVDGPLAVVFLLALMMVLILLIKPFKLLGIGGYGIYGILCLALAIFSLLRATDDRLKVVSRAWYGILGGMFTWTASEMASLVGGISIENYDGLWFFLIAFLPLLTLIYRKILSGGALFFVAIFYMNWGSHLLLKVPRHYAEMVPFLTTLEKIFAIVAGLGIAGLFYWIFARCKTRTERIWCAVWVWMLITVILYVVKG